MIDAMLVMAGALLGAPARYLVDQWVTLRWRPRTDDRFPLGTFVVNMSGSFLMGLLLGFARTRDWAPEVTDLLAVGMLGSYTTFSTFAWESFVLQREGETSVVIVNVMGSVVLGTALAATGLWLGGVPG